MQQTCPVCQRPVDEFPQTPTLIVCGFCRATYVPEGARSVPVLATSCDGGQVALSPEFTGRFRLKKHLGSGAMGTVYLAEDLGDGHALAVKFLPRVPDERALSEFLAEGRLRNKIQHRHVVTIHEVLDVDGHPCLVSEYMDGGSLRQRLERLGRLRPVDALTTMADVLAGLHACHLKGVVHRDVKPENILFTQAGIAKLGDLGIARDYGAGDPGPGAEGSIIGTPLYMAPECLQGHPAVVASDVFSAGVVLHEVLVGALPFDGRTLGDLLREQTGRDRSEIEARVAEVSSRIAPAVVRALAVEPHDRYLSADELRREVSGCLDELKKLPRSGRVTGGSTARQSETPPQATPGVPEPVARPAPRARPRETRPSLARTYFTPQRGLRLAAGSCVIAPLVYLQTSAGGVAFGYCVLFTVLVPIALVFAEFAWVVLHALAVEATDDDPVAVFECVNQRRDAVRVEHGTPSGDLATHRVPPGGRCVLHLPPNTVVTIYDERTNRVVRSETADRSRRIVLSPPAAR